MVAAERTLPPRDAKGRFAAAAPKANVAPVANVASVAKKTVRAVPVRRVQGRYDAAQTTNDNRRHWANADALSADAAMSASVRKTLRNRSRYEVANNSYAAGIVETLADYSIGTGPRLQMLTNDDEKNRAIEEEFEAWAAESRLADKLHVMRMARTQDGEAFAIMVNNPRIDHRVKLDLKAIEADRVTNPIAFVPSERVVDGIEFDVYGNPISYRVLNKHPGGSRLTGLNDGTKIPAKYMLHMFRPRRVEQHRGIPELTPALPLFAQLRRYTLAVIAAAETAAEFAGVIQTNAPADGNAAEVDLDVTMEIVRNMLITLPDGWTLGQLDAKQPTTTYVQFVKMVLTEIARCLKIPYNVAAGSSEGYNYASGRLDNQTFYKSIRVDQAFIGRNQLDRILGSWLWEYALATGEPLNGGGFSQKVPKHQWFWEGQEHVDPAKEATALEKRLRCHATTLSIEYAKQGLDSEEMLRQAGREKELMDALGLTVETAAPAAVAVADPEEEN